MHVSNDGSENSQPIAKKFVAVSVIMNMKENFTTALKKIWLQNYIDEFVSFRDTIFGSFWTDRPFWSKTLNYENHISDINQ